MKTQFDELLEQIRANPEDSAILAKALASARKQIKDTASKETNFPRMEKLATELLEGTGMDLRRLREKNNTARVVAARRLFCQLAKSLHIPGTHIEEFLHRKHGTVNHHTKSHTNE